jgi:hypothetical protein
MLSLFIYLLSGILYIIIIIYYIQLKLKVLTKSQLSFNINLHIIMGFEVARGRFL